MEARATESSLRQPIMNHRNTASATGTSSSTLGTGLLAPTHITVTGLPLGGRRPKNSIIATNIGGPPDSVIAVRELAFLARNGPAA